MFEMIFQAIMAWHLIGMLLIAVVFGAIGAVMVGYHVFWKAKAKRIRGRIKAVYVRGGVLDPLKEDDIIERHKRSKRAKDSEEVKPPGKVFYVLFMSIPMIFMLVGVYFGYKYFDLSTNGAYAEATVIRNDASYDSDNGTSYAAVVSFVDQSGQSHEAKDNISYGGSPSYSAGTKVGVYYHPHDPQKFMIADFWHNMLLPFVFFLFGLGFMVLFTLGMSKSQKGAAPQAEVSNKDYTDEMYYALYEYQDSNGNYVECLDDGGSNSLTDKIPGEATTLLMMPGSDKVTRLSVVVPIIGLIFIGVGVFVGVQFVAIFDFNPFVLIFTILGGGYIAFRIRRAIMKIPADDRKEIWEFVTKGKFDSAKAAKFKEENSKPKGRALNDEEVMVRLKHYRKQERIGSYLGLVIALGLMGGAYYTGNDMIERVKNGASAQGIVTDITSKRSRSSDGDTIMYYSTVEFTAPNGETVKFKDSMGASYPLHKDGQAVPVLYYPDQPTDAMIDRGIWNWGISTLLAIGSVLLLLACLRHLGGGGRSNSRRGRV